MSPAARVVVVGAAAVAVVGLGLVLRAVSHHEPPAAVGAAKLVSVEKAQAATFRASRTYIGTVEPWNAARVGPQFVSAYVGTVLVRPGARVKRGEVLATLDCRNASASSREIAARAEAIEERQAAMQHEAERVHEMEQGGFASANELEQLRAKSAAASAEAESMRASLASRTLEVDDCVLRAPFAGEVSERFVDPGAYVRPGSAVATVIDRSQVRIVGDAPEVDFGVVAPETPVRIDIDAAGAHLTASISRRAPAADVLTRTVHFEIDVPNADHKLPVGATARLGIDVGKPRPATEVPARAASVRGDKAKVFVVQGEAVRSEVVPLLGESAGSVFVDPQLPAGSLVVVEGRALLDDGDRVVFRE